MSNNQQVHITVYDPTIIDIIINDIERHSSVKYYIVYQNKNINPNWYFIYLQCPFFPFDFETYESLHTIKILILYYMDNSNIIYNYISQFKPFKKESFLIYSKLNRIENKSNLSNNEFSDLNDIKTKSLEYYNNNLIDYTNISTLDYSKNTYTGQQGLIVLYDTTNLFKIISQFLLFSSIQKKDK